MVSSIDQSAIAKVIETTLAPNMVQTEMFNIVHFYWPLIAVSNDSYLKSKLSINLAKTSINNNTNKSHNYYYLNWFLQMPLDNIRSPVDES